MLRRTLLGSVASTALLPLSGCVKQLAVAAGVRPRQSLVVSNDHTERHTLHVEITEQSEQTPRFEDTVTVAPDEFKSQPLPLGDDPNERETFVSTVRVDEREPVSYELDQGGFYKYYVTVRPDGTLDHSYSVQ